MSKFLSKFFLSNSVHNTTLFLQCFLVGFWWVQRILGGWLVQPWHPFFEKPFKTQNKPIHKQYFIITPQKDTYKAKKSIIQHMLTSCSINNFEKEKLQKHIKNQRKHQENTKKNFMQHFTLQPHPRNALLLNSLPPSCHFIKRPVHSLKNFLKMVFWGISVLI